MMPHNNERFHVNPISIASSIILSFFTSVCFAQTMGKTDIAALRGTAIGAEFEELVRETEILKSFVHQYKAQKSPCWYGDASVALSEYFSNIALKKHYVERISEARKDLIFLRSIVRTAISTGCDESAYPNQPAIEPLAPPRIYIEGSEFKQDGRPQMLFGPMGHSSLGREHDWVSRFGFNVIGDDFNSFASFRSLSREGVIEKATLERLRSSWELLHRQGLAIAHNPSLHYVPLWLHKEVPDALAPGLGPVPNAFGFFFPFSIDSPSLRRTVDSYYRQLLPGTMKTPGFRLYWLMNEPTYENKNDPRYVAAFRRYLHEKYGDISRLNHFWGTKYSSFNQISVDSEPMSSRYDRGVFHLEHVSNWFRWLASTARSHHPKIILSNKPQAYTLTAPDKGIDFEDLSEVLDVLGSDGVRQLSGKALAFSWQDPIFLYDFQKSVSPRKPLADLEFHLAEQPNLPFEYVYATIWQSFLHGVRLATFWVWDVGQLKTSAKADAGKKYTAWSQPKAAWALSKAALDLRRLAETVSIFPERPNIAIYYGMPSMIISSKTRREIKRWHLTLNGLGIPIGFVTDKMIRAGRLSDFKMVIVPDAQFVDREIITALRKYTESGGNVVLAGESFTHDQYVRPISPREQLAGSRVLKTTAARDVDRSEFMRKVLVDVGLSAEVTLLRRDGSAPTSVEYRCAVKSGKTICYVIGLGTRSQRLQFRSSKEITAWTDLISGARVPENSIRITPFAVKLIRLE